MSTATIPQKMKAVVLVEYNTNLSRVLRNLQVIEKDLRPLHDDEVLVKMMAAPCNPSDIAFFRGMYNIIKPLPAVAGFEGTGTVVAAGKDQKAIDLLRKRVSCFNKDDGDGTWAEYFITIPENCIRVRDELDTHQAACLAINPLTGYALTESAQRYGSKTVINTAAAGRTGEFIRTFAKEKDLKLINLVRKDEHIVMLKNAGEEYVLNIHADDFQDHLTKLSHDLKANTALDALGGEWTGKIIQAMPEGSQLILYGGLSGQYLANINVLEIIFRQKTITGFNLIDWIKDIGPVRHDQILSDIQELMINGTIRIRIQKTFKLEEVVRGLLQYAGHLSDGKILFIP
jgi:NADPH:quinone reductase-like Zn-dependent oxidoreductase